MRTGLEDQVLIRFEKLPKRFLITEQAALEQAIEWKLWVLRGLFCHSV
jgi:hypothetical protein